MEKEWRKSVRASLISRTGALKRERKVANSLLRLLLWANAGRLVEWTDNPVPVALFANASRRVRVLSASEACFLALFGHGRVAPTSKGDETNGAHATNERSEARKIQKQ